MRLSGFTRLSRQLCPIASEPRGLAWSIAIFAATLGCSSQPDSAECGAGNACSGGSSTEGAQTGGASTSSAQTGGTGAGGTNTGGTNTGGNGACTLVDTIDSNQRPSISFDRYHSLDEMKTYFSSLETAMPTIAKLQILGQTAQGSDLFYLVINATCQDKPPAFLGLGAHHGDEKSSSESVLAMADYLLKQAVSEPVNSLLKKYAVYLLPVVNPDGFLANTRANANGIDLNRDYSYPGHDDAGSFTQVETQLVKSLHATNQFRAAVAYHSGALEVIWPWCYTGDPTADEALFVSAGKKSADAMGFTVYQQSYDDYPSQGEYIDYAYWKYRTRAATFEVSTEKTPSIALLPATVDTTWKGTLAWLRAVSDNDSGVAYEPTIAASARRTFPMQTPMDSSGKLE